MQKLETVVIDIPNKIFEINHTPIPKNCSEFEISFKDGMWSVKGTANFYFNGKALRDE